MRYHVISYKKNIYYIYISIEKFSNSYVKIFQFKCYDFSLYLASEECTSIHETICNVKWKFNLILMWVYHFYIIYISLFFILLNNVENQTRYYSFVRLSYHKVATLQNCSCFMFFWYNFYMIDKYIRINIIYLIIRLNIVSLMMNESI